MEVKNETPSRRFLACGISFHASPLAVRERVALSPEKIPEALEFLERQPGVHECLILSTCNRTELYVSADPWVDGQDLFLSFARQHCRAVLDESKDQVYAKRGARAVQHLFRVASSLDSLVLGEPQILGQLKSAFRAAEQQGCVDRDLHRWVPRAFAAAKKVRSGTGITESPVNVSYAAVQLARKIFEDLTGRRVLILGAGKMSRLAGIHLREAGAASIRVANRTGSRADELARECSGSAVDFERRASEIAESDIVVCSTGASSFILGPQHFAPAPRRRPILVLDISVPRNVDPRVGQLDGVYLFDLDDLKRVVEANRDARLAEAERAECIVRDQVRRFLRDEREQRAAPAIAAARKQVHSICREELDRLRKRLPALDPKQEEELEVMLHRIGQKLLHPVIRELKNEARADTLAPAHRLADILPSWPPVTRVP